MARKRNITTEESQRQSRKEILLARKQARQLRQIRLAIGGVGILLALVFVVALVNEFIIAPNRPVAVVSGQEIPLQDWEERVQYERAQRIILLENQLEALGGDVGIIQQFAGQMIIDLQDSEAMAQNVLDQMVDEEVMRQLAEERGIRISEAEIDEAIGETFNYFGGESPTPFPTPTETIVPTPSITPIPTAVITEVLPTATPFPTPTIGPTSTPRPTATPVSREEFEEQLGDLLGQFSEYGVEEETYRALVRVQLIRERLLETLAEESELPTEAEHASILLLSFNTEDEAEVSLALIEDGDFLTVWNTILTAPAETELTSTASEVLWRTREELTSTFGEEVSEAAFNLPVNQHSEVLARVVDAETTRYHLLQVSGREVRPLSDSILQQDKFELLATTIEGELVGNLESTEFWRSRVPTQPVLDPKFLAPPTPTPAIPGASEEGIPLEPAPGEGQ